MKCNVTNSRQSIRMTDRSSILLRLDTLVDLTSNVSMIEKLVVGGVLNRRLPDLQPNTLTTGLSRYACGRVKLNKLYVCFELVFRTVKVERQMSMRISSPVN